jgi:hypothetical protein
VAAFLLLYAQMGWLITTRYLAPLTLVEALVISSQAARMAVVFAYRRLRDASIFSILDLLSLETFAFPAIGLLGLVTGSGVYRDIGLQLIFGWAVSLLLLSPSIMVYRFARAMHSRASLSVIMPSSALLFGLLGSLQSIPGPRSGAGGPPALFGAILSSAAGASLGSLTAGTPELAAAALVVFAALLVYATSGARGPTASRPAYLSVALAGVLGALGWEVAFSQLTTSSLLLLTLPTAVAGGVLWWVTREAAG